MMDRRDFINILPVGAAILGNAKPGIAEKDRFPSAALVSASMAPEEVSQQDWLQHQPQYLEDGFPRYKLDVVAGALYDTFTLKPGECSSKISRGCCSPGGRYGFFENAGPISGKTYLHTNMVQSSKLPAPESFLIKQICFYVDPDTHPQDLRHIRASFWDLWVGQKQYARSPMVANGPVASNRDEALAQPPSPELLALGHYVGSLGGVMLENWSTFGLAWQHEPFTAHLDGIGVNLLCVLRGIHARGVC